MKRLPTRSKTTFPISPGKLRLRLMRAIFISPLTWLPYLAIFNLWLNQTFHSTGAILSCLAITSCLIFFYGVTIERRRRKIVKKLIHESNQKQDIELSRRALDLANSGHSKYSAKLINFIALKGQIETALHEGTGLTKRKEEVDNLVDTICFGAADQLEKLAELDARLKRKRSNPVPPDVEAHIHQVRTNIATQLFDAYATLNETWENLGDWFDHDSLPDSQHPDMDAALEHLKREQEIVYRVKNRMTSEWAAEFPESKN